MTSPARVTAKLKLAPARAVGAEPLPATQGWAANYASRLSLTDALVVAWATFGAQLARFGLNDSTTVTVTAPLYDQTLTYTLVSIVIVLVWLASLAAYRTRDPRIVGVGSDEYKRITTGSLMIFGLVAIAAFLLKFDLARGYILVAFPVGLAGLLVSRWIWRAWLVSQRRHGRMVDRVLLLGSLDTVTAVARDLIRSPAAGYQVVGAVVPGAARVERLTGTNIPVTSNADAVVDCMASLDADTLVVTSSDELPPQRIRAISWNLEPGRQHLVMAPTLTDVAGPRIHIRPVAGLPLVHVETPRFEGAQAFTKRVIDIVGAGALIIVSAPVLLVVAALVRLTSPGPVLYQSERIGHEGKPFKMLKFRSMRVGADAELAGLLRAQGSDDKPLFKITDDPRITPLGKFLRRYSIDELPQFFNVFVGTMSLVGPRPQVAAEVALYDDAARRRLLLKPGISGLWQVSGRSNLSWEEAIRLDLFYVENWSVVGDLQLLWRTAKAVVGKDGAY